MLDAPCDESNEMTTLSPPNCRISLAQSVSAARRANALSSGTGKFGSSECNNESKTCVMGSATKRAGHAGKKRRLVTVVVAMAVTETPSWSSTSWKKLRCCRRSSNSSAPSTCVPRAVRLESLYGTP